MTQTLIETIEETFEPIAKTKNAETLAEAVSNKLMETLPRLSQELFERVHEADVKLSERQVKEIDKHYHRAHHGGCYVDGKMPKHNISRLCRATIPVFAYACVPDQKEIVYANAGKISYEETFNFSTTNGRAKIEQERIEWFWHWEGGQPLGSSTIEVKSTWNASFPLDVRVNVPEVPTSVVEICNEALMTYYNTVQQLHRELKKADTFQNPKISVLWSPTDESLYCSGDVPLPPKNDPVLILDIPNGDRHYRHVVAAWNISEERPFKNWLAEYSE